MLRQGIPQVLPRLRPGPWISAGRVLNYQFWSERERFRELDLLIDERRAVAAMTPPARRLPPSLEAARNRRILTLRASGLTTLEIARHEGMKDSAVRQVLRRARRGKAKLDEAA